MLEKHSIDESLDGENSRPTVAGLDILEITYSRVGHMG
jgi:hypothetical protein